MRCRSILWKLSPLRTPQKNLGRTDLRTSTFHRQGKKIRMKLFNNRGFPAVHSTFQKRLLHISHVKCKSLSESSSSSSLFLTPGFQPSKISGSTFYADKPPGCLPILDASVILNPGKFCKRSSWKVQSPQNINSPPAIHLPRKQGSISGIEAAQRLVDARREFRLLMNHELRDLKLFSKRHSEGSLDVDDNAVRKIYALKGHGVPQGLLQQMVNIGREWLQNSLVYGSTNANNAVSSAKVSARKISLTNVPGSTFLDTDNVRVTDAKGKTYTVSATTTISTTNHNKQASFPYAFTTTSASTSLSPFRNDEDWERNLEMYMVVMNRIGSRLAFVGLGLDNDSIVTPARLNQWDVTITKGESLPASLLPSFLTKCGNKAIGKESVEGAVPILTVEWIPKSREISNIVLRLQDEGLGLSRAVSDDLGSGARVTELTSRNSSPSSIVGAAFAPCPFVAAASSFSFNSIVLLSCAARDNGDGVASDEDVLFAYESFVMSIKSGSVPLEPSSCAEFSALKLESPPDFTKISDASSRSSSPKADFNAFNLLNCSSISAKVSSIRESSSPDPQSNEKLSSDEGLNSPNNGGFAGPAFTFLPGKTDLVPMKSFVVVSTPFNSRALFSLSASVIAAALGFDVTAGPKKGSLLTS
ncbi:hypothetical protein ACHAXS_006434 [Conticribra weissflogii]